tara:strand:+ start:359 stop:976 length:618 start_codon:yes stop_codon:yes gene_type:complete
MTYRKQKRRGVPFEVFRTGSYEKLTPLQQAFYLELWLVADTNDTLPADKDTLRSLTGRIKNPTRIYTAIDRLIDLNLLESVGDFLRLVDPRQKRQTQINPGSGLDQVQINPGSGSDQVQINPGSGPDQPTQNNNQDLQPKTNPLESPLSYVKSRLDINKDNQARIQVRRSNPEQDFSSGKTHNKRTRTNGRQKAIQNSDYGQEDI